MSSAQDLLAKLFGSDFKLCEDLTELRQFHSNHAYCLNAEGAFV